MGAWELGKKGDNLPEVVVGVLTKSPRSLAKISLREWRESGQRQCLPISIRLVNPGSAGLLLGPFPRLGALDDHCLYPSTRDLRLNMSK